MENEFNPSKKDLILIDQLILDIKQKKSKLINRKIELQNSLSQLRTKYQDVGLNSPDFKRIKSTRQNVKDHLNGLELKIKGLNEELAYKNKVRLEIEYHLKHHKQMESKEDVEKLLGKLKLLSAKYKSFTKDRTRISSLRIMAAEVHDELNELIKSVS